MPTMFPEPRSATVIKDYRTQYHHPIGIKAGESVALGRYDDQYPGWVWTTTADGNSGWAPVSALDIRGDGAIAHQDYIARELDVDTGQNLVLTEEESGWYWAERDDGTSGWVPAENLHLETDSSGRL